jgi:diguanylate cyclase (GGDEF)-like protein/PAS domain S-box-containing protein
MKDNNRFDRNDSTNRRNKIPKAEVPYRIILIYVVAGVLWVLFSDILLAYVSTDPDQFLMLQTYKGWFYVLITGLLLYVLINKDFKKMLNYQTKLIGKYEELEEAYKAQKKMEERIQKNLDHLQEQQKKVRDTEERHRLVVEGSNECIWDWDIQTHTMNFSRTKQLLGYDEKELNNSHENWTALIHPEDRENATKLEKQHLDGKTPYYYCEYRVKNKWDEYRWIQSRGKAVWDDEGNPLRMAGSHVDVTEQKRIMSEMYQMAYYDDLTGLPNRSLFYDRLQKVMGSHQKRKLKFGILTMDLADFRRINDTRGRLVGDRVMIEIARRIDGQLQENEFAARSSGIEFYILKSKLQSVEDLEQLANRLLNIFEIPFSIDDYEFFIRASIGMAIYPDHGDDRDTLLQHADVALSEAKTAGNNKYWIFDQKIRDRIANWMENERDLRYAVQRKEFELFYQPVVEGSNGMIRGAEALIRWHHPEKGILKPETFIPLAEETDLIHPIGEWVMETACKTCRKWNELGFRHLSISVNISPVQFRRADLPEWISRMLAKHHVDPTQLVVEITESVAMDNVNYTLNLLSRIRELGVKIALDDFGTGYSSLNYLRSLPLDILKIDKSFINELGTNPYETFIVRQIIEMAHELNLTVTAEGVEEAIQVNTLIDHQCDHLQGYYFYRPLTEKKLNQLLQTSKSVLIDNGRNQ